MHGSDSNICHVFPPDGKSCRLATFTATWEIISPVDKLGIDGYVTDIGLEN
jgi:hypothetical protein